jgi:hypothetical protein
MSTYVKERDYYDEKVDNVFFLCVCVFGALMKRIARPNQEETRFSVVKILTTLMILNNGTTNVEKYIKNIFPVAIICDNNMLGNNSVQ